MYITHINFMFKVAKYLKEFKSLPNLLLLCLHVCLEESLNPMLHSTQGEIEIFSHFFISAYQNYLIDQSFYSCQICVLVKSMILLK